MPADGYGPSLATSGPVWVAGGAGIVALDPSTGEVVLGRRLHEEIRGPIAVAGDVWAVGARRGELLRIRLDDQ